MFGSISIKARDPKAVMKIETLNATFQPAKIGNPCGLQITYLKDNSTRNIFVYHSDAKVLMVSTLLSHLKKNHFSLDFSIATDLNIQNKLMCVSDGWVELFNML